MKISDWSGCYDGGWKGLIVPESFGHPAKFSYRLIQRIYDHGFKNGFWGELDVIGDPFGGVGLGGICAAYAGLKWVGVELEPRFVKLAAQNFAMHAAKWCVLEAPFPSILQGDSRRFASLVGCDSIVTSPPYQDQTIRKRDAGEHEPNKQGSMKNGLHSCDSYGTTPGQIGALKAGELDAVVTSPPYAESIDSRNGPSGLNVKFRKDETPMGYGRDQIAMNAEGYGHSAGQIGALPSGRLDGQSPGQLGNSSGETYWQAVAQVYAQCAQAMKPGGIMAVVVKSYVKNKKLVDLPEQTWQLLIHLGFEPIERVRALLTTTNEHPSLFGGTERTIKKRASFFRRLAEKNGSPPIDWEEVLWVRVPVKTAENQ